MSSRKQLHLPPFPSDLAISKSRKAGMKKEIILMLTEKQLGWSHWTVASDGQNFVNVLTECLWYLDGHHTAFKDRSVEIPSDFQRFQGYNKPEDSKHRRKDLANLSASTLDGYSSTLNKLLLQPWFDLERWKAMRRSVAVLADGMAKYAGYLKTKCVTIKENHTALTPVRGTSDCESFCVLHKATWVQPSIASRYRSLQDRLDASKEFEPFFLNDHAPSDTR